MIEEVVLGRVWRSLTRHLSGRRKLWRMEALKPDVNCLLHLIPGTVHALFHHFSVMSMNFYAWLAKTFCLYDIVFYGMIFVVLLLGLLFSVYIKVWLAFVAPNSAFLLSIIFSNWIPLMNEDKNSGCVWMGFSPNTRIIGARGMLLQEEVAYLFSKFIVYKSDGLIFPLKVILLLL